MAARTLTFIFKVIILTVILCVGMSLVTLCIDVFTTVNRIQNVTDFVQFDIAQNNCLLNDTYEMYVNELYAISEKSRNMTICTNSTITAPATVHGVQLGTNEFTTKAPVELEVLPAGGSLSGNDTTYIQTDATVQTGGKLLTATSGSLNADEFGVAPYGEILTLGVNAYVYPTIFYIADTDGSGGADLNETGYMFMEFPLTLTYHIPALAYIKG